MSLIIRIDVDRPYGRHPFPRHVLSRVSSDIYFPRVAGFGYLTELKIMLTWLNGAKARAYAFFRRCTLPSLSVLKLLDLGGHEIGLHLENSRSYATFLGEKRIVERHAGRKVVAVSKHGSGGMQHGLHHYAPYEPQRYVDWARQASMRLFLGNLQDPSLELERPGRELLYFPSAFWLEPSWRNTKTFTVDWLLEHAQQRDIVLLVHPENVLADPELVADFKKLIESLESRILQ
jgi:hypothetical protein